jgi:ubiquinone/menaquinone biosynthesis C-methylase UbiE
MKMSHDESSDATQRKQQVTGIFDRGAPTYDHIGPRFFSHFGRRLVEIAKIPSGSKVLDVATGRGALLYPAAESVGSEGHVIGIDLSEIMVQETVKELAHRNASRNIELRQMDAEHLQFPGETFDYVLCGFAIFFFPQLDLAMSEFRRVLKPNGQICISTWDKLEDERWSWFDEIVKTYIPAEPEANQTIESDSVSQPVFDTPEGLVTILNAAGFSNIQIFSEASEFVYASDEELWSTLWSHGARATLEKIEQTAGTDGLQRFKSDVFKKISAIKQTDSLHQLFSALIALATKQLD